MFVRSWQKHLIVGIAFAITFVACASREPALMVSVGNLQDFSPGSVTELELQTTFDDPLLGETSPVPIQLVNHPNRGLLALYNRDPHRGCRVRWWAPKQLFLNPCHGEKYTLTGEYVEGPALRGLDRFAVIVTDDGTVLVDVSTFQMGPPRQ